MILEIALLLVGRSREALPPDVHQVANYGCNITLNDDPQRAGQRWWMLHVWADRPTGRWNFLDSVRPEKDRSKSLADCDRWMKAMHEAVDPAGRTGKQADPQAGKRHDK